MGGASRRWLKRTDPGGVPLAASAGDEDELRVGAPAQHCMAPSLHVMRSMCQWKQWRKVLQAAAPAGPKAGLCGGSERSPHGCNDWSLIVPWPLDRVRLRVEGAGSPGGKEAVSWCQDTTPPGCGVLAPTNSTGTPGGMPVL